MTPEEIFSLKPGDRVYECLKTEEGIYHLAISEIKGIHKRGKRKDGSTRFPSFRIYAINYLATNNGQRDFTCGMSGKFKIARHAVNDAVQRWANKNYYEKPISDFLDGKSKNLEFKPFDLDTFELPKRGDNKELQAELDSLRKCMELSKFYNLKQEED